MAANRKFLQLAGSTLSKIQALDGENAVKARELLVATDTGSLVLGTGSGAYKLIGSVPKGTSTQRASATPVDGQLYLDTTEVMLYRGNGSTWEKCVDVIPTVKTPTEGDLVKLAADGTLVDTGHLEADVQFKLTTKTTDDLLSVDANGFMADSGIAKADVQLKLASNAFTEDNIRTTNATGFAKDSGVAIADIQTKIAGATDGHVASFDENGFIEDSGTAIADVQTKVTTATDGNVASFDENGFVEDAGVALADVQTKLTTSTTNDILVVNANGFYADSGTAIADVQTKVASATSGDLAGLDGNGFVTDSGVAAANVQQKLSGATTDNLLVAAATGFMADSGIAKADVQTKLTTFTSGNVLTVASTGFYQDSGVKFDDNGSAATDVWSASKVIDYVTDSISGMSWQAPVKSQSYVPAATPAAGDRYLVGGGTATGAWADQEGKIAEWNGESWEFTTPVDGMAVFLEDTDHQMAYNGTSWVDISAGFTYSAGNGIDLTNNTFSAVGNTAAGIGVDGSGIKAVVDTTSIVFDANGAISAKVKANNALNVDSTDGLNVAIDNSSIVLNDGNALMVKDLDFGTW